MTTDTVISGQCVECGTGVERLLPSDIVGPWRRFLEGLPMRCAPHQAEAEERWEREERERDEASRRAERQQREAACGLPLMLRRLRFEELDRSGSRAAAVDGAREWAAGELRGLMLVGSVGRGKTRIAATAAWEMMLTREVRWRSASMVVAALDREFGSAERTAALSLVHSRVALVLDDLDKVRPTDAVAEQMLAAIEARVSWGAPLLITSNLSGSELAERWPEPFGEAIVSRLRGYCRAYRLSGEDRRVAA